MSQDSFPQPSVLSEHDQAIAVLFSNRRSSKDEDAYSATAHRMETLAARQPGFLGVESVRDESGRGITISYWKDRNSALSWKNLAEHLDAQRRGREGWYESYVVRVARMQEEYGSDFPGPVRARGEEEASTGRTEEASTALLDYSLLAQYAAWANHRMLSSTARLHEIHHEVEIGRKSITGLWKHMLQTDATWLDRFRESGSGNTEFESLTSFEDIRKARLSLDQEIIDYFQSMDGPAPSHTLTYRSNIDGKTRTIARSTLYFHFFNHQTYHRGQLTVVLAQLGVAAEMTDIVWMFPA